MCSVVKAKKLYNTIKTKPNTNDMLEYYKPSILDVGIEIESK